MILTKHLAGYIRFFLVRPTLVSRPRQRQVLLPPPREKGGERKGFDTCLFVPNVFSNNDGPLNCIYSTEKHDVAKQNKTGFSELGDENYPISLLQAKVPQGRRGKDRYIK